MSDSVDRVFVHALQTVRRLPRTGSSRPPPSARLRLYGLYKQSMEGDVSSILPRPSLPPTSPDPSSTNVHRYASKDLRLREAQAEMEKWDAWNECAGMSRTEAKRRYISTLIDTMKVYASGTPESRELIAELEFVWSQIRSQSGGSSDEENNHNQSARGGGGSGSGGKHERESPTRRLERAGLKPVESYGSTPPGRRRTEEGGGDLITSEGQRGQRSSPNDDDDDDDDDDNNGPLRVLSPVSREGPGDIVEGRSLPPAASAAAAAESDQVDVEEDDDDDHHLSSDPYRPDPDRWRRSVESALNNITTELAALREQIDALHSSSSFSFFHSSYFYPRHRNRHAMLAWMRWLIWIAVRQVTVDLCILALIVLWARWRGINNGAGRRIESWLTEVWSWLLGRGGRWRKRGERGV